MSDLAEADPVVTKMRIARFEELNNNPRAVPGLVMSARRQPLAEATG